MTTHRIPWGECVVGLTCCDNRRDVKRMAVPKQQNRITAKTAAWSDRHSHSPKVRGVSQSPFASRKDVLSPSDRWKASESPATRSIKCLQRDRQPAKL